jgi:hypothetical protein
MSERENPDMMDAATAAVFTGLAVATLAKPRCLGGGPVYLKLGRKVIYRRADLADWLSARRVANPLRQRCACHADSQKRLRRHGDAPLQPLTIIKPEKATNDSAYSASPIN